MMQNTDLFTVKKLSQGDVEEFEELLKLFAIVFDEYDTYQSAVPDNNYLNGFIADQSHVVLVAITKEGKILGGLVAYVLDKFEQKRSEIFVYDLAVLSDYRRKGIATKLLDTLTQYAREIGAHEVFVQAEKIDVGAQAFYRSIADNELDAVHFEIRVNK